MFILSYDDCFVFWNNNHTAQKVHNKLKHNIPNHVFSNNLIILFFCFIFFTLFTANGLQLTDLSGRFSRLLATSINNIGIIARPYQSVWLLSPLLWCRNRCVHSHQTSDRSRHILLCQVAGATSICRRQFLLLLCECLLAHSSTRRPNNSLVLQDHIQRTYCFESHRANQEIEIHYSHHKLISQSLFKIHFPSHPILLLTEICY